MWKNVSNLYFPVDTCSTLVILEEIQVNAINQNSLKYFCEQAPEYHIVAAGSLLGVALNREKSSFPVGKVDVTTMLVQKYAQHTKKAAPFENSLLIYLNMMFNL